MRMLVIGFLLISTSAMAGKEEDLAQCRAKMTELAPKADAFAGDAMIKRLIEADLRRALKEEKEGDGDECIEALDHATKLLAGQY